MMRLANTKRHKKMWQSPRLPPYIYSSFPFNFGKNPPFLKFESEKLTDIITPSPTNAQRCFLLLRANQLSFIIEGNRFFDEKPSLQTLVDQLVGAKPRKMPRGEPRKKNCPAKIQTWTPKLLPAPKLIPKIQTRTPKLLPKIQTRTPKILPVLRWFLPSHITIEIPYLGVIKDISIITWFGKNRRSELRLGGVWESKFDLCGAIFVAGISAWQYAGLSPASFSPAKSPARRNEPVRPTCGRRSTKCWVLSSQMMPTNHSQVSVFFGRIHTPALAD